MNIGAAALYISLIALEIYGIVALSLEIKELYKKLKEQQKQSKNDN